MSNRVRTFTTSSKHSCESKTYNFGEACITKGNWKLVQTLCDCYEEVMNLKIFMWISDMIHIIEPLHSHSVIEA